MIFKTLRLKNFKSHKNTFIKFEKGISVIVGENGAGKSTVLEGISFALFKLHGSKKIDNLIRNNTEDMTVELEFECNNKEYKIIRNKKKSLRSFLFIKNNNEYNLLCKGENIVGDEIQNILNMDSTFFSNAIYVKQGAIADLINKSVSEKKSFIGKLIGIDLLEDLWKTLGNYITKYEKELAETKGQLRGFDTIDDFREDEINKLNEMKNECEEKRTRLETLKSQFILLANEKEKLEEVRLERIRLESLMIGIEKELNSLISDKEKTKAILEKGEKSFEKIKGLEKEIDDLKEYSSLLPLCFKIDELKNNLNHYKAMIKTKNRKFISISKDIDKNYKSLDTDMDVKDFVEYNKSLLKDIDKELVDFSIEKEIYKEHIRTLNKSIDQLSEIDSVCPLCHSEINEEEKNKIIEEYKQKIFEDEKKIKKDKSLDSRKKEVQDNIIKGEKILEQINLCKTTKDELEELIRDHERIAQEIDEKTIDGLDKEIIEEKVDLLHEKERELSKIEGSLENHEFFEQELLGLTKAIIDSEDKITEIKGKVDSLNFNEKKYEDVLIKYEHCDDEINSIENDLEKMKLSGEEKIYYIKKMTLQKSNFEKLNSKYKSLFEYIELLKKIRLLYSKDGIQKDLRNVSKPLIQKYTKEFFNKFNFAYSDLSIDDDYDIKLFGPEGESSSTMISGGEKIAIALALRLGITQAISKGSLDVILLDEPTIHLDDSRRNELINLINEMSFLPQMIIVTHENQLENVADNLIKIKKQNGVSYLDIDVDQ